MDYLAILIGAILLILLVSGIIYFFGSVLRSSLSGRSSASSESPAPDTGSNQEPKARV